MLYHPVFEFLPVEHFIREHQQEYYRALAKGDDSGDCTVFVAFILTQIETSLNKLIEETRGVTLTAENRFGIARTAFGENVFTQGLSKSSKDNFNGYSQQGPAPRRQDGFAETLRR